MDSKRFKSSDSRAMIVNRPNGNGFMEATEGSSSVVKYKDHNAIDPMNVPHVLGQIFQNFSVEELKHFRLVSKHWDSVATKILQEKSDPISFCDEFYDSEKMRKIVKVLKYSVQPPYVKFEIASKFFTLENEDLITEFFYVCGPFMEYLTILTDRNRDSKFKFAEVVLRQVSLCRLKGLVFEDHTGNEVQNDHNHDFSTFFKALLSAASNLERLDLSFPKYFFETDNEEDEGGVIPIDHRFPEGIICSRSSQQLKHLEITAKITDPQLVCLSRSGLRLKTLHFRVRNVSLLESSFMSLLESQRDTLEALSLTEERLASQFLVKFPVMKELKKITIISICEFENSSITFAPFGYQEHLPKIETLKLWNCFGKEERWAQFFLASSPSLSMTRVELPTQFRNVSLARNISTVFPVLKKLQIGFSLRSENEGVMRAIFETLISLEELDIRTDMDNQNENIDHILSGIPKDVCHRLKNERNFMEPGCLEGVVRVPSLANLKNLRRLEIIMDNNRAPFITDVTGYLAFMQMAKLRVLRFSRYGMSQECIDTLTKTFRLELLPLKGRNFFEIDFFNLDFEHTT